jgi:tol-pal system protein YbgF
MRSIVAHEPVEMPARHLRNAVADKAAVTVAIAVVVALAGCASTPAEDDPVQVKLTDLDTRVARIERVVSNQSLVELAQNLDSAQADIRRLRGQIEELQNSNEQMKKRLSGISIIGGSSAAGAGASLGGAGAGGNAAQGAGPNGGGGAGTSPGAGFGGSAGTAGANAAAGGTGTLGASGGGAAAVGGAAGVAGGQGGSGSAGTDAANAPGAAANPGTSGTAFGGAAGTPGTPAPSSVEQAVYNQAFEALKAGSYSVAITSFKDFLANYPASPLAENSQYWLGEAFYVTRSYDDAGNAFRAVLQKWPSSRKAPDAMVKLGFTQYELKKYADSRKTLEEVTQKYPDSDAARLATERLKRIPANPH